MPAPAPTSLRIPASLLPADGRFGCGPSKVRPEAVAALARHGTDLLGTSHRQAPVKALVARVRAGIAELFGLPDGWEVVLGNGGSTLFWDVATFCLLDGLSQHCVFGEFSGKFAEAAARAPQCGPAEVRAAAPGTTSGFLPDPAVDAYCTPHNETSTGAAVTPRRPAAEGLVLVDATSAAGGLPWDPAQADVYYFAPQKCFASDGGLWIACCSPAALARAAAVEGARWVPASLSLSAAAERSRVDETLNTPAVATLVLLVEQLDWMLANGGMPWAAARCATSAATLYGWAEASPFATPFVADPAERSALVGTVDLDAGIDHTVVCAVLRANGVVDLEPYRKLGRNQLRVGMFPAVDPADVAALTACVDWVVERLA
ncbi:MAG TPA: phosphoserine transaminase [Acidimicrobiales bacterium]|nr:phosphoserine transaminase [Acidimicrobiales bacterium]